MTLDEFKRKSDAAAESYSKTIIALLEEAVVAKIDERIVVMILERSFAVIGEKLLK